MKYRVLSVVLVVMAFLPALRAEAPLRSRPDNMRRIRVSLDSLDRTIDRLEEYRTQKKHRIEALEARLKEGGMSPEDAWKYTDLLYTEYASFRSKDQFKAAKSLLELSLETGESDIIVESYLRLANTYLWAGAFKEAQELLDRVDTSGCSVSTRADYLNANLELQYEAGLYAGESGFFQEEYAQRIERIAREIESLLPPSHEMVILAKERLACFQRNHSLAYKYALQRLSKSVGSSYERKAEILGNAGFYNLEIGDTLTAVSYMTRSAALSLRSGSRQEPALRKIAESIYPLGEVGRAHRYISLAMDNASFYGSGYRMFEASLSLPKIDQDVYGMVVKERKSLYRASIVIFAVLLILAGLFFVIWRQNKYISKYTTLLENRGKDLNRLNTELEHINGELQEANLLKGAYLERTLAEDSMNISLLENLISDIERKVKVRQFDDIIPYIYRNNYLKTRQDMLRRFDNTFLGLFPDFVEQVNGLLDKEYHFQRNSSSKDLPVELRILALMRLGVQKSVTIGEILNISDSTVRNYKTRLRNHSVVPNGEFDSMLMVAVHPKRPDGSVT